MSRQSPLMWQPYRCASVVLPIATFISQHLPHLIDFSNLPDLLAHHLLYDRMLINHSYIYSCLSFSVSTTASSRTLSKDTQSFPFSTMGDSLHKLQPQLSSLDSVTASSRAYKIPELLELILMHLPAVELLKFQRINSTWRDVIRESSALQEKLFYKSDLDNLDVDDRPRLEINSFVRLLHRRQYVARRNKEADANSLGNLDYPEASWKKMYLSRPAICKIEIRKKDPDSSPSDLLMQITQHDTIQMNHLRENCPKERGFVRFSHSDGIRMYHLQEMDLSAFMISTSDRKKIMVLGGTHEVLMNMGPDEIATST